MAQRDPNPCSALSSARASAWCSLCRRPQSSHSVVQCKCRIIVTATSDPSLLFVLANNINILACTAAYFCDIHVCSFFRLVFVFHPIRLVGVLPWTILAFQRATACPNCYPRTVPLSTPRSTLKRSRQGRSDSHLTAVTPRFPDGLSGLSTVSVFFVGSLASGLNVKEAESALALSSSCLTDKIQLHPPLQSRRDPMTWIAMVVRT